jgi:hypothetical protein
MVRQIYNDPLLQRTDLSKGGYFGGRRDLQKRQMVCAVAYSERRGNDGGAARSDCQGRPSSEQEG